MEVRKKTNEIEETSADAYAPKKMSAAQNAMLTLKLFGILGVVGAALWGINALVVK